MFPCSTVSAGNILVLSRNTVTEVTQMAGIELHFPCLHKDHLLCQSALNMS